MAKAAEEVSVPFGGFWVQTGVFKSFGVNSKAVYMAFVDELHAKGGIKLKDGRIGKIATKFYDSGCKAEEALAVVRKMASVDKVLLAVGPTCSSALEPVCGCCSRSTDSVAMLLAPRSRVNCAKPARRCANSRPPADPGTGSR